ncbi:hypothetical protein ABPG72_020968 [Tetrahymena utriculariae]
MNLFKAYNDLLTKYPLTTKCVTSGFMFGLGDAICQLVFEENKAYNFRRTANIAFVGSVFAAPALHKWYGFLPGFCERNIFYKYPKMGQISKTLIPMAFDQTVFAFSFTCYFFMVVNYVEYQSIEKGITSIKEKSFETMIANWKLWPAAQMINFSVVPIPYRVLFANFVGLIWNIYLSWIQHRH